MYELRREMSKKQHLLLHSSQLLVDKDNENQTLIKEQQIYNLLEIVIEGLKEKIIEKIKIARSKDKKVVRVVKGMKKAEVRVL